MNTNYTRARIQLTTLADINNFVRELNRDGSTSKYTIENFDRSLRVSARSIHGVIYAAGDFGAEMYVVNETEDGVFPSVVDIYRV